MKPFEKWKTQEVKQASGLQEVEHLAELVAGLQAKHEVSEDEKKQVLALQKRLKKFVDYQSEEELKVSFVAPFVDIANFYEENKYRLFMETTFSANVQDLQDNIKELYGRVEFLVNKGKQPPQSPFFFTHEYKLQLKSQNNLKGQLLVTMLASQAKSQAHRIPVYGLYTIDRNCYFMVLIDKNLEVSSRYDTTNDTMIRQAFSAIKQIKLHIKDNYQKAVRQ